MTRQRAPAVTVTALLFFWLTVSLQGSVEINRQERPAAIVVTGPIQLLLYGGDRFLAANIDSIRAAASATANDADEFRMRAHRAVSSLNPCHEDNYWIGNASLSWGGAEKEGFRLLLNAMNCRYWDEWPAFFYGFNQHFFLKNVEQARYGIEIAAQRSRDNAAVFRTFSTMLAAREIDDSHMALQMLQREHDTARDPSFREMLKKRITRLQGLIALRDAQREFETRLGRALIEPKELLEYGLLESLPNDPLRLGYEFRDQTFHLRQQKIQ